MKNLITAALLTALSVGAPGLAIAGPDAPGVDKRQHQQHKRVGKGVKSGELTRRETRGLLRGQRHIAREERRYKADGQLTGRERADLHRDLTRTSRQIYRHKHDGQSRGGRTE